MKTTKYDIEKKYGKSRCSDVQYYINRLRENYGFPNSEETLYQMIEHFQEFTTEDFSASFKKLDAMKFYGPVKRSHIWEACEESKADRVREKQLQEPLPKTVGCPMPDNIREKLKDIFHKKYGKREEG
jgi:hypothetical protein